MVPDLSKAGAGSVILALQKPNTEVHACLHASAVTILSCQKYNASLALPFADVVLEPFTCLLYLAITDVQNSTITKCSA